MAKAILALVGNESLKKMEFSKKEYASLKFVNDKEFILQNLMYDVVSIEVCTDGTVKLVVVQDDDETKFHTAINHFLTQSGGKDTKGNEKPIYQKLSDLFYLIPQKVDSICLIAIHELEVTYQYLSGLQKGFKSVIESPPWLI